MLLEIEQIQKAAKDVDMCDPFWLLKIDVSYSEPLLGSSEQ